MSATLVELAARCSDRACALWSACPCGDFESDGDPARADRLALIPVPSDILAALRPEERWMWIYGE